MQGTFPAILKPRIAPSPNVVVEEFGENGSGDLFAPAYPRVAKVVVEGVVGPEQLDKAVRYAGLLRPLSVSLGLLQRHQAVGASVDKDRGRVVGI